MTRKEEGGLYHVNLTRSHERDELARGSKSKRKKEKSGQEGEIRNLKEKTIQDVRDHEEMQAYS